MVTQHCFLLPAVHSMFYCQATPMILSQPCTSCKFVLYCTFWVTVKRFALCYQTVVCPDCPVCCEFWPNCKPEGPLFSAEFVCLSVCLWPALLPVNVNRFWQNLITSTLRWSSCSQMAAWIKREGAVFSWTQCTYYSSLKCCILSFDFKSIKVPSSCQWEVGIVWHLELLAVFVDLAQQRLKHPTVHTLCFLHLLKDVQYAHHHGCHWSFWFSS